jgi:catechol 2,3-dioxygenase-like lactoylglutathione lyase family enzyme
MKIAISSVMVDDQEKALDFYTRILGFTKKTDVKNGDYRWLTVESPDGAEGVELLLEPMGFPPARVYQKSLYEAGIPSTVFFSADIQADFERLKKAGVKFRGLPVQGQGFANVLFEDGCGNLINLAQVG